MRLYKFRSLENFEYLFDILLNLRFYTSLYTELNDPMEGVFDYFRLQSLDFSSISNSKMDTRICSFSNSFQNSALWAHYADGFKGICIELEIDESKLELRKVSYSPFRALVTSDDLNDPENTARNILSVKDEIWKFESEYRVLSSSKYISDGIKIKRVLFGIRTSETTKSAIKKLLLGTEIECVQTSITSGYVQIDIN